MIKKLILSAIAVLFFCCFMQAQPVLSLDTAISQALQSNYDVQISKNDADIAAISNTWALAGRLPTVNANLGYTYSMVNLQQELSNGTVTKRSGTTNRSLTTNLGGNWRIFNGYRVIAAKARLEEQQKIGKLNLLQQMNQTAYNVINNYYNIIRLQQQHTVTSEMVALLEERVKLSKARFEIGTAAKNDYLQSQIDLNDQRSAMLQIEKDMQVAKAVLNNLLSRDPMLDFLVELSTVPIAVPEVSHILQNIDTMNPGLLAAKSNEVVLIQQHREIKSQLYPTVSLLAGANFNQTNSNAGFTLLNQTLGPQFGVSVAVPLFQGGVVKKQLQINDIQLKTQKVQTESMRNGLRATLANAYSEYMAAKKQYEIQQQSIAFAKENSEIAMERFRKAAITLVDLRQVQLSLVAAQTAHINAQYVMRQSEAALQFLIGSLAN